MIDYHYLRHHDYSGIRTVPFCTYDHSKGTDANTYDRMGV